MKKYDTLQELIEALKLNPYVVGIAEYGGREFTDNSLGGDYDFTVFHNLDCESKIGGVHFHVGDIPIDCMFKNINTFEANFPENDFDYVHLNCSILYDPSSRLQNSIDYLKSKYCISKDISDVDINMYRFSFKHILDKLEHRLYKDELYSYYHLTSSLDWFIECYGNIKCIEIGKVKLIFKYIKENNLTLYQKIQEFYLSKDLRIMYNLLTEIAKIMLTDLGGLWNKGEILWHLNASNVSEKEKKMKFTLLFE